MTAIRADYRITERSTDTDTVVRVVAMLSDYTFAAAVAVERESIPASGNYIRLERFVPDDDDEIGAWELL